MFRLPKFVHAVAAREWLALVVCGACLGLLLVWLQKSLGIEPHVIRIVLLVVAMVLLFLSALLLIAYVRELRREEDEWAGRDEQDADERGTRPTL
ncbi:MAG TPA: hypothetical protein VGW12_05995 [Pyrinomonadaceae bacterium]|nr:hypothetical protein [Pyrinomonadaceae bacterium]